MLVSLWKWFYLSSTTLSCSYLLVEMRSGTLFQRTLSCEIHSCVRLSNFNFVSNDERLNEPYKDNYFTLENNMSEMRSRSDLRKTDSWALEQIPCAVRMLNFLGWTPYQCLRQEHQKQSSWLFLDDSDRRLLLRLSSFNRSFVELSIGSMWRNSSCAAYHEV